MPLKLRKTTSFTMNGNPTRYEATDLNEGHTGEGMGEPFHQHELERNREKGQKQQFVHKSARHSLGSFVKFSCNYLLDHYAPQATPGRYLFS
jgi:hypothetical protein